MGNVSKEMKTLTMIQMEMLDIKTIVYKMKNAFDVFIKSQYSQVNNRRT